MAQQSVDTLSKLPKTDFTQVNVQTNERDVSARESSESDHPSTVGVSDVNIEENSNPSLYRDLNKVASVTGENKTSSNAAGCNSEAFNIREKSEPKDGVVVVSDQSTNSKLSSNSCLDSSSVTSNNPFSTNSLEILPASKLDGYSSLVSSPARDNASTLQKNLDATEHGRVDKSNTTPNSFYKSNIINSSREMTPLSSLQNSPLKHNNDSAIDNVNSKPNRNSLELNLKEYKVSSKPQLEIKTLYENQLHMDESEETDLLLDNKKVLITSNANGEITNGIKRDPLKDEGDEDDRPVLHVQFHSEHSGSNSTVPIKDPCPSPTESLSSSSSSSSSESIDISEARPPDGGWGWVIVAASFVVNLIADGVTFSFGVIFVEFVKYFDENRGKTAWIGSLFMAMPLLSGPIASFLTDRYGCRKVTMTGALLASSGFVISSFANSTEMLFVTFGIIAGFGLSLCYVASVVIVAYYFDKRRSFATGLSVCGSGIGTFIFAQLTQALLDEYGWRGTTLILAGIFLNLAVCGALMKDLPWTPYKKAAKERKRSKGVKKKKNDSSVDTFSVSNSTNTASALQPIAEDNEKEEESEKNEQDRLFSSLVNLPTYVRNGEKVPVEVLELLSTHKNVYNVLMQNYPGLLAPSRSFSDSGRLHEAHLATKHVLIPSPLAAQPPQAPSPSPSNTDAAYLWWLNRHQITPPRMNPQKKLPTAYLKDLRVHRLSLTYRGAMLNINRYRLRASSCPDIYRNSMTTIAKEKNEWWSGLWEFWELLVDIVDFSHFADPKFLVFAISNFLLYAWYDVPYVYLTDNAINIGFSEHDASKLIAAIGIVNMVGEVILGWAGDRPWINAGIIYAVCMGLCGAVTALVPLVSSYWGLCALSGAFGLFIAANYSLTCIILVELITLERFTNAYGLLLLVQGVANLVGPPLAGWLYDITGTYDLSFYLAGLFIAISGVLLVIVPATRRYRKFQYLQRQTSSDASIKGDNSPKEPKFHNILASCITGKVTQHNVATENHV